MNIQEQIQKLEQDLAGIKQEFAKDLIKDIHHGDIFGNEEYNILIFRYEAYDGYYCVAFNHRHLQSPVQADVFSYKKNKIIQDLNNHSYRFVKNIFE